MDLIRVLIADDHPMFRKGLLTLLQSVADLEVVGQATTGQAAIELAEQFQPDVILMDLQMPDGSGIAATRVITMAAPAVRILVVTLFDDDDSVSGKTVSNYVSAIFTKLQVADRAEAIIRARDAGLG